MKTIVQISDDVRIVGGGVDWSVESRHISETTKKERWDFEGSYPSPKMALQSLIDGRNTGLLVGAPEALTLSEFVEKIERASRVVASAVKKAGLDALSASRSS